MRELKKITFLLGDFALQTPAQQILDRFLLGYPRDGGWRKFAGTKFFVVANRSIGDAELTRRVRDYGLVRTENHIAAWRDADGVVLVPDQSRTPTKEMLELWHPLAAVMDPPSFVVGTLGPEPAPMRREMKSVGRFNPVSGTWVSTAARLPQVDVPNGAQLKEALVVVQGPKPEAELHGLDLLLSLVERRKGATLYGERVETFVGADVWRRGDNREWSWALLAAALSRSNSPQGDSLKDARPQDLVGLGLVQKLAREPRCISILHKDGLRSTVLVLDGVVADINFAVQLRSGEVISAQVLRSPAPAENHYSRLVAVIDDFFRTGKPPWPASRGVLLAELLSRV